MRSADAGEIFRGTRPSKNIISRTQGCFKQFALLICQLLIALCTKSRLLIALFIELVTVFAIRRLYITVFGPERGASLPMFELAVYQKADPYRPSKHRKPEIIVKDDCKYVFLNVDLYFMAFVQMCSVRQENLSSGVRRGPWR
jgi:hypothetical protein